MTVRTRRLPALLLTAVLAVAACGGSGAPAGTAAPGSTSAASQRPTAGDRAWATTPLVDVATNETFRIADLAGKVVIIETMAIWCTNCRRQQASVEEALAQLPADRVVYVVLDVDANEDAASLAAYRTQYGYTGRYAVVPAEVARSLAEDFGNQFLSPPSTPMVIVGADGTVTLTPFGQKSSDELVALARAGGA